MRACEIVLSGPPTTMRCAAHGMDVEPDEGRSPERCAVAEAAEALALRLRAEASACLCAVPAKCPVCVARWIAIDALGGCDPYPAIEGAAPTAPDKGMTPGALCPIHDTQITDDGRCIPCAFGMPPESSCANCGVQGGHRDWCTAVPLEGRVLPLVPAEDAGRSARPRAARNLVVVSRALASHDGSRS